MKIELNEEQLDYIVRQDLLCMLYLICQDFTQEGSINKNPEMITHFWRVIQYYSNQATQGLILAQYPLIAKVLRQCEEEIINFSVWEKA